MTLFIPFTLAAVLAVSTIASAAEPVVLGSRYFDRGEGFSLRPPAGCVMGSAAATGVIERFPDASAIAKKATP